MSFWFLYQHRNDDIVFLVLCPVTPLPYLPCRRFCCEPIEILLVAARTTQAAIVLLPVSCFNFLGEFLLLLLL